MNTVISIVVKGQSYPVKEGFCPVCEGAFDIDFGGIAIMDGQISGHDGTGDFVEPFADVAVHRSCL